MEKSLVCLSDTSSVPTDQPFRMDELVDLDRTGTKDLESECQNSRCLLRLHYYSPHFTVDTQTSLFMSIVPTRCSLKTWENTELTRTTTTILTSSTKFWREKRTFQQERRWKFSGFFPDILHIGTNDRQRLALVISFVLCDKTGIVEWKGRLCRSISFPYTAGLA